MSDKDRDLGDTKISGSASSESPIKADVAPELISQTVAAPVPPSGVNPDIHRLVWVLLRGWWIILIVFILAIVYSGYSLTNHSPVYTSHMVVREIDRGGGLALPGRISGLAEGLGARIKKGKTSPLDDFKILLGMDRFAQELDRKYEYVREVYGGQWSEETQSWKAPTGWRTDLDDYFRGFAPIAEWTPPSTQKLAQYIAGSIFLVDVAGQSSASRIQYQHPDADFALQFLSNVYQTAEEMLRSQELERISNRASYVRERLASVTISDYRESLIFVLAEQEKKLLELQSGQPYVADVIQPPIVTDQPSSPNILIRLILGAIVGLALGAVLVVIIAFLRSVLGRKPIPPQFE